MTEKEQVQFMNVDWRSSVPYFILVTGDGIFCGMRMLQPFLNLQVAVCYPSRERDIYLLKLLSELKGGTVHHRC